MTQVIIQDIIPRTQLVAAAGQTVFNTNWTADASTDINVYARTEDEPPDDITQIVSPSLYNVTFIGGSQTVRVTFLSGRALDDVITIVRNTPATRTNLYINTNFVPSMLNQDFGILTLVDQQAQMYDTVVNPGYNVSATIEEKDKILPILAAQQVWRMNDDNTAFEPYTLDTTPPSTSAPFIIYEDDPTLEEAQNLGLLTSGILKQTVAFGVATLAIAIPGVDYFGPGGVVPVNEGGTGADNAADARTNLGLGDMAVQNSNNVNITGGVGNFTAGSVASSPTLPSDLVNKAYADSIASGFTFKAAALVASTTNLSATYANGASGVGATLTEIGNGALSLDGVSPGVLSRVLIKDQSSTANNGVYVVTDAGSAGTPYILTRATDFDTSAEILPGSIVFIQSGNTYADTSFVETEPVVTVGTSPILFIQFSQQYPLSMGNGGTGASITPVVNNLVYSTASNLALLATLASGVLVTSAGGVPSISTTLPSGLTIPGFAHSGANSDITSMTGLTGVLRAPTFIDDSLSAHVLGFSSAGGTPVNYINILNAITATYPTVSAVGSDTNIALKLLAKGNGIVQLFGGSGTTTPLGVYSGTSYQHITLMNFSNTSATRNVTFQDADGTLAYLADRGYVLLSTATASSSAALTFTGVTGYSNYMLAFNCLTPATNGAILAMQGSTDNGSTWLSAAASYYQQSLFCTNATVAAGSDITTLTYGVLSSNILNTVPGPSGFVIFENLGGATRKGYSGQVSYVNSNTSTLAGINAFGWIATSTVVNALRVLMSAGNITSGTAQLYGMK
jgi:hypothetical protein